jgi:ArsR family transcriptional regulator
VQKSTKNLGWQGLTRAFFPDNIFAYMNMTRRLITANSLFRAFADPTRLRVLSLLLEGEICVCDLCAALKAPQPRVSRHLAYLRRARLVQVRQAGKWKYYALERNATGLHRTLLDCVRDCLREVDVLQRDLTRLAEVRRKSRCCDEKAIARP